MTEKDSYYLTDTTTGERNPHPEEMTAIEATQCNERLERMKSRSRWVKIEKLVEPTQ